MRPPATQLHHLPRSVGPVLNSLDPATRSWPLPTMPQSAELTIFDIQWRPGMLRLTKPATPQARSPHNGTDDHPVPSNPRGCTPVPQLCYETQSAAPG